MSREQRRFVRVYYVDLKRDYPTVYYSPTGLSTWLRLLVASDESWPSTPELPAAVRRTDLELLRTSGLVTVLPGRRFTLKGYVAERGDRQEKARKAAGARYRNGSDSSAAA